MGTHLADTDISHGPKAAKLGELIRAGFNVPTGYVLKIEDSVCEKLDRFVASQSPVAVRSSATAEDGDNKSFAGYFTTKLDVDASQLVEAIAEVRASFNQSAQLTGSMNVIVQKQIDCRYSGVIFTMHPLEGTQETALVNFTEGMAEDLVSGKTSGSHATWNIEHKRWNKDLGAKQKKLSELAQVALEIAALFGLPQDIEWGVDDQDQLWIFQSRPITAFSPRTDLGFYTNADLRDGGVSSFNCTPLMFSIYRDVIQESMADYLKSLRLLKKPFPKDYMIQQYGRVYWDVSFTKSCLEPIPGYTHKSFYSDLGIDSPDNEPAPKASWLAGFWLILGILWHTWHLARTTKKYQSQLKHDLEALRKFEKSNPSKDQLHNKAKWFFREFYPQVESKYFHAFYTHFYVHTIIQSLVPHKRYLQIIEHAGGLQHFELSAEALNRKIEYQNANSEVKIRILDEIADKFYFYSPSIFDLKQARLGEQRNHDFLIGLIENAHPLPALDSAPRGGLLEKWSQFTTTTRENLRQESVKLYYYARFFALNVAQELKHTKILRNPNDIFYFHWQEILSLLEGQTIDPSIIISRKQIAETFENFSPPNEFGQPFATESTPKNDGDLKGLACSKGVYQGKARVLKSMTELHRLNEAEILVTKFADPAWTPALVRCSAVVTEVGGILSHAAIVARELKVPAVLKVENATTKIKDGDTIVVDGNLGTIELIKDEGPDAK